jgi:hypothetical protein
MTPGTSLDVGDYVEHRGIWYRLNKREVGTLLDSSASHVTARTFISCWTRRWSRLIDWTPMCNGTGIETMPSEDGPIKYACKGCKNCRDMPKETRDIVTTEAQDREAMRYEDDITRRWD